MARRRFTPEEIDRLLPLVEGAKYGDVAKLAREMGRSVHTLHVVLGRMRPLSFAHRTRLMQLRESSRK